MPTARELRDTFDASVRTAIENRPVDGVVCTWDGPLLRCTGLHQGFVTYRDLGGAAGAQLDELIARTCRFFARTGTGFEWKTYSHDEPADLTQRLRAAGFVAQESETVVIGEVARIAADPVLPEGVTLAQVSSPEDFAAIAAGKGGEFGEDWSWLAEDLGRRVAADADSLAVLVARAPDETIISSAWVVFNPDGLFAGLWGGSTAPAWRGRGIYRALVARRAQLARARGYCYLQVDALETSRPILERLGFVSVTETTPYLWTPPA
jgi:GNAT superfamily N-acetyltransferase